MFAGDILSRVCLVRCLVISLHYWNGNVFILMKFSSLAALKVVKMTTSSAASDENFVKMTTFSFQCIWVIMVTAVSGIMQWSGGYFCTSWWYHQIGKCVCLFVCLCFFTQLNTGTVWNFSKTCHDDVIECKHFPRYCPFVRGIHRSSVNSPHKGQWRGAVMFSLISALNKQLSKQSWSWGLETS